MSWLKDLFSKKHSKQLASKKKMGVPVSEVTRVADLLSDATSPKAPAIEEMPQTVEQVMEIVKKENLSVLICYHKNYDQGFIFEHVQQPNKTVLRNSGVSWDVYWGANSAMHTIETQKPQEKAFQRALEWARTASPKSDGPGLKIHGRLMHWKLDGSGTLTLSGNGPMPSVHIPEFGIHDWQIGAVWGDILDEGSDEEIRDTIPWNAGTVRKIIIEPGLTTVSRRAFATYQTCVTGHFASGTYEQLQEIILPDTVKILEEYSFYHCDALRKAVIPAGVAEIHKNNFGNGVGYCRDLIIKTDKGSCAESFAKQNGIEVVLTGEAISPVHPMAKAATNPIRMTAENIFSTVLVIPAGTKVIKLSEYQGRKDITQVVLPEGLETIQACAFRDCANLEKISFPRSLKSIGSTAFSNCEKLKQVRLPEGLESIDNSVFFDCADLEKVYLPGSLKKRGDYAFSGCRKLISAGPCGSGASVEFGATDRIIRGLFDGCSYLERVFLPEGVETIESAAFRDCKHLAKINLPASLKKMGDVVWAGCDKLVSAGPPGSGCSMEYSVTDRIPPKMFMSCRNLRSVQLPAGITGIGESAFSYCKSLEKIEIPEGVKELGARAFVFCSGLKHLVLPESVEKIGESAFRGCDQLADRDGFVIVRSVLYGCLKLDGVVKIPQGVTTIDSDSFALGMAVYNDKTTEISLPDSVMSIVNQRAFLICTNLEIVRVSENASAEVKQVAQMIADRAEERRRERKKPKPISTPEQLSIFRNANRSILRDEVYQAIIAKFQAFCDKDLPKWGEPDPRWSESATMISLHDEESHWVGHDDTITESIELKFERLSEWEEPLAWSAESEWPCEGEYQCLNESKSEGNNWSYFIMSHKAWLLKEPFGLPGVWRFECMKKRTR